jgi:hypothetical protein
MKKRERNRFRKALDRKRAETEQRSRRAERRGPAHGSPVDPAAEQQPIAHERPQDVPDPRTKSSGHGQKTADKWNQ